MSVLRNFLVISRAKVQTVSFASATLGVLLGAGAINAVLSWDVVAFILLFYVLITFACNINCYCDVEVDRLRKRELQKAVSYFGKRKMRIILALEAVISLILALFLGLRGHYEVTMLAAIGLFLGWAYSSPPLRTKGKGTVGPLPVILGVYVLPIIAGYLLVNKALTLIFILFVGGYALMNLGINLVNTCEDYSEDRKLGIRTFAHAYGLRKTLNLAFTITVLGGLLGLLCLLSIGLDRIYAITPTSALAILIFIISCITAVITAKEIYAVGQARNLEKSAKINAKKMPKWFVITRYPMWLFALSLLFV